MAEAPFESLSENPHNVPFRPPLSCRPRPQSPNTHSTWHALDKAALEACPGPALGLTHKSCRRRVAATVNILALSVVGHCSMWGKSYGHVAKQRWQNTPLSAMCDGTRGDSCRGLYNKLSYIRSPGAR